MFLRRKHSDPVWRCLSGLHVRLHTVRHRACTDAVRKGAAWDLLTERWGDALKGLSAPDWDEGLGRIAQYGICRHWFQAVSDWDLCCRVKLILSGCALMARLPGPLTAKAQLWSKEIENSAENLDTLLDDAYCAPSLTDANLLGLLA